MIYDPLGVGKQESGQKPAVDTVAKEVIVVTIRDIITGVIRFSHQQRLLDAFNKGPVVVGKKSSENHVTLHDICIYNYEGEKIDSTFQISILKDAVLFVIESAGKNITGAVAHSLPARIYPYREKKPIKVKVTLPAFVLNGTVYGEKWQQITSILEQENDYMAMTNISFKPVLPLDISCATFAAVNKNQIIHIVEST